MASRLLLSGVRGAAAAAAPMRAARGFHATARSLADAAVPLPARKPVGAFRGGYVEIVYYLWLLSSGLAVRLTMRGLL